MISVSIRLPIRWMCVLLFISFFIVCLFCNGFFFPLKSKIQWNDSKVDPLQHTTLNMGNQLRLSDCEFSSSPDTFFCSQGEALRQTLVNRYYGNVKAGPRRDSVTTFSNGPLAPAGPGKSPTGV